jgi:fluoride exporter
VGTRARASVRRDPRVLFAVSLGGALGGPARYGITQLVDISPGTFPWGTFWINVSGGFALGLFFTLVFERVAPTRYLRPFMATGFLGAYTTYSTFAVETDLLVRNGHWNEALAYAVASLAAGFSAAWGGILLARAIPRIRRDRHAT